MKICVGLSQTTKSSSYWQKVRMQRLAPINQYFVLNWSFYTKVLWLVNFPQRWIYQCAQSIIGLVDWCGAGGGANKDSCLISQSISDRGHNPDTQQRTHFVWKKMYFLTAFWLFPPTSYFLKLKSIDLVALDIKVGGGEGRCLLLMDTLIFLCFSLLLMIYADHKGLGPFIIFIQTYPQKFQPFHASLFQAFCLWETRWIAGEKTELLDLV